MKFTKYKNPNKKRARRKLDYTERCILTAREALTDARLGYTVETSYYTDKMKKA